MSRKPLMAGNWKMNLNHVEAVGLVQKLAWTLEDKKHDPEKSEVVVLPPFTDFVPCRRWWTATVWRLATERRMCRHSTTAPIPVTSPLKCW